MAGLLRRISINLERRTAGDPDSSTRALPSTHSFNDFSMHTHDWGADDNFTSHTDISHAGEDSGRRSEVSPPPSASSIKEEEYEPMRSSRPVPRPSPFVVGSAPPSSITTNSLKIPHTSVAHLLMREHTTDPGSASTPRSSLDMHYASLPSPRNSLDDPGSPTSPKSPTTPGGRRRKQQKIDGLDYYTFCELVRTGSL